MKNLKNVPNLRPSNDPAENVTRRKMITLDKNLCTKIHCSIIYNKEHLDISGEKILLYIYCSIICQTVFIKNLNALEKR